ncbi:zonadhesin isoform X2 [Magallana gigas]|uniref:zonadhesin isoform X2 n=1 Tax=Magallana gigas TaxID=29159 RepID=UPI00333E69C7
MSDTSDQNPFGKCVEWMKKSEEPDGINPFSSCLIDACNNDGPALKKIMCSALEEFEEQCVENGYAPPEKNDWRNITSCSLPESQKCQENEEYVEDGSGCPNTCQSPKSEDTCTDVDIAGCQCKKGYVREGDKCVPYSECGCMMQGRYYPQGTSILSKNCNVKMSCKLVGGTPVAVMVGNSCGRGETCKSTKGIGSCRRKGLSSVVPTSSVMTTPSPGQKCGDKFCATNAECIDNRICTCLNGFFGIGDIQCTKICSCGRSSPNVFKTFDGKIINFSGKCRYQLSSFSDTSPRGTCSYSVDVMNKGTGDTYIIVNVLDMDIRFLKNKIVKINGQPRTLPAGGSKFIIYNAGFEIRLYVPSCGILIGWDGTSNVVISVPTFFSSGLDGICGNCNGDRRDDPTNVDVYSKYATMKGSNTRCKNTFTTTKCNRRSQLLMRMKVCKFYDGTIKSRCNLTSKENAAFKEACINSGCNFMGLNQNEGIKAGCNTLDLFSSMCRAKGHNVNWRIFPLNDCRRPTCNSHLNMETNFGKGIPGCPHTCGFTFKGNCTLPFAEGCKCKAGYLWDGNKCVKPNNCGCTTPEGDYISIGKTLTTNDCSMVYKCEKVNGKATLQSEQGPCVNTNCIFRNDQPKCTDCKQGYKKTSTGCIPIATPLPSSPATQTQLFASPEAVTTKGPVKITTPERPMTFTMEVTTLPSTPVTHTTSTEVTTKQYERTTPRERLETSTIEASPLPSLPEIQTQGYAPPQVTTKGPEQVTTPERMMTFTMKVTTLPIASETKTSTEATTTLYDKTTTHERDETSTIEGKCINSKCPTFASCLENVCTCNPGFVNISGECKEKCKDCPLNSHCVENKCTCKTGFVNVSGTCIVKCLDRNCQTNARCVSNKCACKFGFVDLSGFCEVKCNDGNCSSNAHCVNNKCTCMSGFVNVSGVCEVKCEDRKCQSNALCKGNKCVCANGYIENEGICEVKCTDSECPLHSACVDNKCKCMEGFVDVNGICEVKCVDSECQANAVCRHNKCTCKIGFVEIDGSCEKKCHSFNCPRFASCVNNNCACNRGYVMIGERCEVKCDVSKCARNAICRNNKCQCKSGYIGNGVTKCQESCGGKVCGKNARCTNYGRKKKCKCISGFYGDGITCTDTCGGKKCHMYARCKNNKCVCSMGTYESGETCKLLCGWKRLRCGDNASCYRGKCKCDGGFEGDGIVCKKLCTCSITSHNWYNLYDGNFLRFAGTCKYTLSRHINPKSDCQYNAEIKYKRTDSPKRGSALEFMEITAFGKKIHLGRNLEVMIDDLQVYLPYTSTSIIIHYSGLGVMVLFNQCSIRLFWNGRGLATLSVPLDFGSSLTGICGNCNAKRDDLKTSEGKDVSNYGKKAGAFVGKSHLVVESNNNQTCESLESPSSCWNLQNSYSFRKCGLLNKKYRYSPFKTCMEAFPELADRAYEACRKDYCSTPIDSEATLCRHLEGFADLCAKRGKILYWRYRVPSCKKSLKCGKNKFYWWSAPACPNMCTDPNAEKTCGLPKTESCRCKHGFVLSGDKCVRQNDCGCSRGPNYYPLESSYAKPDCSGTETCRKLPKQKQPKMVKGKKQRCHAEASCDVTHGVPECSCNIGFTGDGVKNCKPATSCSITENVKNCSATIELAGECFYKSKHTKACRYTALSVTDGKKHRAYVKFKGQGKSSSLSEGQTSLGCADFTFTGDRVVIEEIICDCPGH